MVATLRRVEPQRGCKKKCENANTHRTEATKANGNKPRNFLAISAIPEKRGIQIHRRPQLGGADDIRQK